MLCAITPSNGHDHFPSLGFFLIYCDPSGEFEAMEPPLLRAARIIRKKVPRVDGILLTKDLSDHYVVYGGCVTMREKRYVFTSLEVSTSLELILDFYGQTTSAKNEIILEDAHDLNTHPDMGWRLTWKNGEVLALKHRMDIGKFPVNTPGKEFVEEWVAGLVQLYAQPTYALLRWLWVYKHGEKEDTEGPKISGENIRKVTEKFQEDHYFLAWFPDAKPNNLGEWMRKISAQELDQDHVWKLNQKGPFAAGFYLVGLAGSKANPLIIFCDGPITEWSVSICSRNSTPTLQSKMPKKGKNQVRNSQMAIRVLGWDLWLGSQSTSNSTTFGYSLGRGICLYTFPLLNYPFGPIRITKELNVSEWEDKVSSIPTSFLISGLKQHAAALAAQIQPVLKYIEGE